MYGRSVFGDLHCELQMLYLDNKLSGAPISFSSQCFGSIRRALGKNGYREQVDGLGMIVNNSSGVFFLNSVFSRIFYTVF